MVKNYKLSGYSYFEQSFIVSLSYIDGLKHSYGMAEFYYDFSNCTYVEKDTENKTSDPIYYLKLRNLDKEKHIVNINVTVSVSSLSFKKTYVVKYYF